MAALTEIIDKRRTGETGEGVRIKVTPKMAELLMQRYNVNGRRMILIAEPKKVTVAPKAADVAPIKPVAAKKTTRKRTTTKK